VARSVEDASSRSDLELLSGPVLGGVLESLEDVVAEQGESVLIGVDSVVSLGSGALEDFLETFFVDGTEAVELSEMLGLVFVEDEGAGGVLLLGVVGVAEEVEQISNLILDE